MWSETISAIPVPCLSVMSAYGHMHVEEGQEVMSINGIHKHNLQADLA